MKSRFVPLAASILASGLALSASIPPYPHLELGAEPDPRQAEPIMTPASPAAERAISQFKLAPDLSVSLWAAEPLFANPVAFTFDEQGRAFISETHRYRSSVLDIRGYMPMLEQDLACETIEDRERLIEAVFGDQAPDLALESELVRLVQDSNGDGVADDSRVFATGFNSKLDGIASGVLARHGQVWFTNIPSLWHFTTSPDGITATSRTELLRGFGIRFGYTGHDLHGLILGPDGKLYFSIGDRATNVTTTDGRHVKLLDQGAVFRANPDGTAFEIVATGLRNPQELAFNEFGDLLTGDNDCDNGDLERLVHVVEGGDSGWRIGYQFAPRGRAGPWLSDHLWKPAFAGRPAYLLPPIANIEDGPSGIAYYPGTGLTSAYDHTLFITHFKGSVARSGIYSYRLEPSGASFKVTASQPFISGMLPTDVTFAPDGRLFFSDWVVGWPKSKMGRLYAVTATDRTAADLNLSREVQKLIAGGISAAPSAELYPLLAHPDQRVRTEAQFELVARGPASIPGLTSETAGLPAGLPPQLARIHALWGLGQLQATTPTALNGLAQVLRDSDAELRAQAAKLAGDHHLTVHFDRLIALLNDDSARVRFFAAQSLGKLGQPAAAPALIELLRRNNNTDAYLRHAAAYALFRLDPRDALTTAETDPSAAVRLGVLLAYRRLQAPAIARFLADPDPYVVREAALAINDAPIPAAFPALASVLGHADLTDHPLQLRAINAHHRLGQPANATALADFAARPDLAPELRAEALTQLANWAHPAQRDRLVGVFRPLPDRDPSPAVQALQHQLPDLLSHAPTSVQRSALAAVASLLLESALPAVRDLVANAQADGSVRAEALTLLNTLNDPDLLASIALASVSDAPALRMATLPLLAAHAPHEALPVLQRMVTATAREQQAAFAAIAKLDDPAAAELLAAGLDRLRAGDVPYLAQVELLDGAEASLAPAVQAKLAALRDEWTAKGDALAPFRGALAGGDRQAGWKLFNEHPVLACTRCHKANGEGGDAGPDLSTIAARATPEYILESIITPNAKIAPGFDLVGLTLKTGDYTAGTIIAETDQTLTIRDAEGQTHAIPLATIAERTAAPSSMPPVFAMILQRSEMRDLMAFVTSLKPRDRSRTEGEGGGESEPRATHGQ